MKKIDMKKTLNERVRNTEWTEENTWNVLRKIRNAKSVRREFSLRRLMPAAVALVLVLGIGVAALTGNPGGPDPIRDKDTYTAQPLVTALSAGQGEGTGDLPEGEDEGTSGDYEAGFLPEGLQLRPVGLSVEKQGIRVEVISAAVKGDESFMKISIQDLEGKYADLDMSLTSIVNTVRPDDVMETPLPVTVYRNGYDISSADTDEEKHKSVYICKVKHSKQIQPEEREVTLGVNFIEFYRDNRVDLTDVLREHGETEEGLVARDYEGFIGPAESMRMLDTEKKLNIPLDGDDILLTGIGWINGKLHIRTENTGSRELVMAGQPYSPSCFVWYSCGYNTEDQENFREESYSPLKWKDSDTGKAVRYETLINCGPEEKDKVNLSAVVINVEEALDDDWTVQVPLSTIYVEDEPVEVETKSPVLDADIAYDISEFFRDWAAGDAELMWGDVTLEWRLSREDGDGSLRSLIASGTPRRYQINDITDGASDGGKIITCTVEMTIPGTEEIEIRRYRVSVKPTEHGFYKVDPAGFIDWEDGEYDPAMEMVLVDQTTVLNKLQSDGYSDTTKYLKPMNLICEKQGIRLNVMSGGIRDQEGWFVCAVEDMEGAYADFPIDPVFSGNFGAEAEVTSTRMYRNALEHYTVYMVYVNYKQPVTPEDCTVTLNMDSVMVHEGAQADLVPLLQEHAKTVEGVELPQLATIILRNRDRGATEVPGLKVLDYTQPLNIPLFNHTYLANAGWIDGKLHVQICHTNRTPDSYDALWINTLLDGKMDILRKEADYSPVDWYDDKAYWYEYIFDYTPEDIEQLEMTAAFLDGRKELKDDWAVSFPLSQVYVPEEDGTEGLSQETGEETDDLPEEDIGDEDSLLPVNLGCEKQGIRVDVIAGMETGDDSSVLYAIRDVDNQYPGLEMEPEKIFNTILPEDCDADGTMYPEETIDWGVNEGEAYRNKYIIRTYHSHKIQGEDRAISLGIKDMWLVKRMEIDMHPYIQEYAKQEEGIISKAFGEEHKILDPDKKLNIPLGRDDLLLTGIGWIDNQLHVRIKYTGQPLIKNGVPYDSRCDVWISGDYIHPTETETGVDYSMLTEGGKTGVTVGQFEQILDCGPDNYGEVSLIAHCSVLEDVVQGNWSVNLPLSMICPEIEPAEDFDALMQVPGAITFTDDLLPVGLSVEKQGIRMTVESAKVKGDEAWVMYSIQDLEGRYKDYLIKMSADRYIHTIADDEIHSSIFRFDEDIANHRIDYNCYTKYKGPVQPDDREVTLGLKDIRFAWEKAKTLNQYVKEYAKEEEGVVSEGYLPDKGQPETVKILDPANRLEISLGREDVLLTGIGWIDNQLHVRLEYKDSGKVLQDSTDYLPVFSAWIDSGYEAPEYSPLKWRDDTTGNVTRYEFILDRGPEEADQIWLAAHISLTEEVVRDEWAVSVPLSAICEGNEPAETAAAETNEEWQDAIRGRVNEILTCWQQKELDDMLAMCTEPWRSERSLLNQILGKRVPEVWQVTDIKGEGWPVVTVGCEIRMQSEADAGFYLVKMKKEEDGLWYFEPAGLGEGNSVYSTSSTIRDEDVILSVNETGSIVKAEEIPPFVSRINEFYTCWSKGDKEGMLALCPPDMRDTGYENFMIYLQSLPGTPQEWKIGHLYGKPEDDIRGASCEAVHLWPNGSRIMNYADIVVRKEADGQWYIIPASIDEIANRYADSAEGIPPVPTDEWHTILAGRLDEFLTCWQKKDKDGLLALCTTPWRSEWDRLNQLLENRTPQSWEIEWVQESGLPVVTVGCSISMQSEEEDGFFRFTAKKGTDGVWYFEPHEMWDTKVSVASPYSITDRDLILTGNEKGFQAKVEEIPPFVYSIMDFMTLWNEGNAKGMLALCQPSGRDERLAQIVAAMVTDGDKPIEWKIGQLYGAPEEDARGAACELTIRRRDGQEIVYPVDITAIKEATGTWYLSCRSVEQISSDMLSAQMKTAEEENNRKNNPDNEEIINCLNEFYSCWLNNDRDGMLALCVPGEDNRGYQSVMDYLLEFGQLKGFYPGEIRKTDNENTRSIHGSVSLRIPKGEDLAYYIDFEMKKADDGQWYIHPDVHLTLMNVVELQEATADGQETRKLAWPITVSMELSADRLAGPAPVNVDISVTNTSGRKLEESLLLYDQTMTQIEAFGASGLDAGETRTWSGEYTVTREQLAEGKVLFFLYFSEYNESTEEFEDHLVSFYRPVFREEAPVAENASVTRSGRPVRVDMELGKDKLSGPETIDVTISVTNVSGDTLAGPVTLYDPDGNQVVGYSEADFAAGETKEWTGKWTVTEAQLAEGKVGFSVKYSDYREGTTEPMAHKLTFSKPITKE